MGAAWAAESDSAGGMAVMSADGKEEGGQQIT